MKKLGVGIAGAAGGVGQAYIESCKLIRDLEVKALCDLPEDEIHPFARRKQITLEEVAKKNDVEFWTSDYEEMPNKDAVNIVMVGVPDYLHTEYAIKALQEGRHVFLTKPVSTTLDEAKALVKAVDKTGLKLLASYGHGPLGEVIERIYDRGEIGEVFFVEGSYIHDQYELLHPEGGYFTPWRTSKEHPRNYLIADGTHPLSELIRVVGEDVDEVFAYSSHKSEPAILTDDFYMMIFKFEGGCIGKIVVTIGCRGHGMGEGRGPNVYGTKGTIYKGKLCSHDQEPKDISSEKEARDTQGHPFWGEIKLLLNYILNEEQPKPPHDVRNAAKIISAPWSGLESIKLRKPVKVHNKF